MVTNYPSRLASRRAETEGETDRVDDGVGSVVAAKMRQMLCAMHGHDNLLQFERERMFLRCVSCGHESPGWELTETPPTITEVGDASRHAMVRPPLVGIRRIA